MQIKVFTAVLSLFLFLGIAPSSYAQSEGRDSFYYMKDDGIFSDDEKDQEAEYIRGQCTSSILESKYFNCACIAGAFRVRRDDEKLSPQTSILNDLYNDPKSKCADPVKIAGNHYKFCTRFARVFRSRKADNEDYCKCVANTISKKFMSNPILRPGPLSKIRVDSMTSCGLKYNQEL
jgi:hypothetical protein